MVLPVYCYAAPEKDRREDGRRKECTENKKEKYNKVTIFLVKNTHI